MTVLISPNCRQKCLFYGLVENIGWRVKVLLHAGHFWLWPMPADTCTGTWPAATVSSTPAAPSSSQTSAWRDPCSRGKLVGRNSKYFLHLKIFFPATTTGSRGAGCCRCGGCRPSPWRTGSSRRCRTCGATASCSTRSSPSAASPSRWALIGGGRVTWPQYSPVIGPGAVQQPGVREREERTDPRPASRHQVSAVSIQYLLYYYSVRCTVEIFPARHVVQCCIVPWSRARGYLNITRCLAW